MAPVSMLAGMSTRDTAGAERASSGLLFKTEA